MGNLNTHGMDDSQINAVMRWQARADHFEHLLNLAFVEDMAKQNQIDGLTAEVEKWKTAALLRDEGSRAVCQQLRDLIERMKKEKAVVVNALRPLVELLAHQPPSSLEYFIGAPLKKAVREAAELLSIIDGQKGGK